MQSHCTPTKAAVHALMQSVAIGLGKHESRCNSIMPGAILTDLNRDVLNGTETAKLTLAKLTPSKLTPAERAAAVAATASHLANRAPFSPLSWTRWMTRPGCRTHLCRGFDGPCLDHADHPAISHLWQGAARQTARPAFGGSLNDGLLPR